MPGGDGHTGAAVHWDVPVRMRDGTELLADVYRPAHAGPAPTILQRTPYGKAVTEHLSYSFDLLRAVRSGWNVVVQDVRGRGGSGGAFEPFRHETADGEDTLAWVAAQPWSDGDVTMAGGSYLGATQWLAALRGPPHLRALAPALTPDDYYDGWVYDGGARRLGFQAHWLYESLWAGLAQRSPVSASDAEVRAELAAVLTAPGLPAGGPLARLAAPFLRAWDEHGSRDDYWVSLSPRSNVGGISVPVFVTAGWFDVFGRGAVDSFVMLRSRGSTPRVRRLTRLVVGPWTHGQFAGTYADVDFGPGSSARAVDLTGLQLRWFDHVVRGWDNGAEDEPAVRAFVMGADEWREFDAWPPSTARPLELELRTDPAALTDRPQEEPGRREVVHDPSEPVPTVGGATFLHGRHLALNAGPRAQAALDGRYDILRYETAPLPEQLEVVGRVRARLAVSCDGTDANVTAKLVVGMPQGAAWGLLDGVLQLSHRDGDERPTPVEPDRVYSVVVDLGHTAMVVPAGATLRLDVAAASFPHVAGVPGAELPPEARPRPRRLTVHSGGAHRSTLSLDVLL